MLTLFTNITLQLTELEKQTLVPMLLTALKQTNEDVQVKSTTLCVWFKAQGHRLTGVRLRKMINYIRVTNAAAPAVVIGGSFGYFLTTSTTVIEEQIQSLQGRIDAMQACIHTMEAQKQSLKTIAV